MDSVSPAQTWARARVLLEHGDQEQASEHALSAVALIGWSWFGPHRMQAGWRWFSHERVPQGWVLVCQESWNLAVHPVTLAMWQPGRLGAPFHRIRRSPSGFLRVAEEELVDMAIDTALYQGLN